MSRVWVLLLVHFWAVNPSRCILYPYASFFYLYFFTVVPLSSFCVFISLCASFVVLALVFLPEFYAAAYRTPFLSWPVDEDVFLALCVLGGYILVVSSVFDFVCVLVSCVFIFIILCVFCVPAWRQCPLLVTFLCKSFCLLSLHFFSKLAQQYFG